MVLQRLLEGWLRRLPHLSILGLAEMRFKFQLDMLFARHRRHHALRRLRLVHRLRRAVLRIVTLLLAQKTRFVLDGVEVHGVAVEFGVELLLRDFFLLAVRGLVALFAATVAYDKHVALHLVGGVLLGVVVLFVLPVVVAVKVGEDAQREVLRRDRVPYVDVHAVRALRTKPEHVVEADLVRLVVPEHTRARAQVVAELAEPLIVVRASFLLLRLQTLFRLGVAVDAVILLVTDPVLLDELADWHLVDVELVKEITFVTAFASISKPVDANFLFPLLVTDLVLVRQHMGLHLVVAHLLVEVCEKAAGLRHKSVLAELILVRLGLRKLRHRCLARGLLKIIIIHIFCVN